MKRCPRCGETKEHSEFFRNAGRHDGLSGYCRKCTIPLHNARQDRARNAVLDALGPVCVGCGFDDRRALTIDHKDGGGTAERRATSNPVVYYRAMLTHLGDFQVLCWNCQHIKRLETGEHGGRRDLVM